MINVENEFDHSTELYLSKGFYCAFGERAFDGEAWRANRSQLIKAGFKYSHKDDISMYFVKYIKGFKVVVELDSNLDKD